MLEKAKSLQILVIFFVFLNHGEGQPDQKFTLSKAWSSNYTHPKFWSEQMKLKAILGLFLLNSVVYRASDVFTLE